MPRRHFSAVEDRHCSHKFDVALLFDAGSATAARMMLPRAQALLAFPDSGCSNNWGYTTSWY